MKYILNVPRVPQQEFIDPSIVAAALVDMKRAINPGVVAERIRDLGESDVLMFGNVSVIAVSEGELLPEKPKGERQIPLVAVHEQVAPDNVVDVPAVEAEREKPRKFEKTKS